MSEDAKFPAIGVDYGRTWIFRINPFTKIEIDDDPVRQGIRLQLAANQRHLLWPDAPRRVKVDVMFLKLPDECGRVFVSMQTRDVIDSGALIDSPVPASNHLHFLSHGPISPSGKLGDQLFLRSVILRTIKNDQTIAIRLEVVDRVEILEEGTDPFKVENYNVKPKRLGLVLEI